MRKRTMCLGICAVLLGGGVLVAGCSDSCTQPAFELTIQFPTFALDADEVRINVTGSSLNAVTQTSPHPVGASTMMGVLSIPGYERGDSLQVSVSALRGGQTVTSSTSSFTPTSTCGSTLMVDLGTTMAPVRVAQSLKNKVDILFMVDNSPSMMPKQQELKTRFPELIKQLDALALGGEAAWYHIGVVTSDLGAGPSSVGGGCVPGGLGGKLQALGRAHDPSCVAPTGGENFIDYNQLTGTGNLPPGQDLSTTFNCMASVGDTGCGFEHQLESVYQALKGNVPENAGFLRSESILVVVFVTDEDDCSAPADTDLFELNRTSSYGAPLSYRCTNFGIMCNYGGQDQLMPYADSRGPLTMCHAAPNPTGNSVGLPPTGQGKLLDLSRYINFFAQPASAGGVRSDPDDVLLVSIAAPPSPVQSIVGSPATYQPCSSGAAVDGTQCAVLLSHSCTAPTEATFFGDPAVRISQVLSSVRHSQTNSICDTDYTSALTGLGQLIASKVGGAGGCFPGPVANPQDPVCTASAVTSGTTTPIPSCQKNGNVAPCWNVESNPSCVAQCANDGDPGQQLGVSIQWPTTGPPPNTTVTIECAILNADQSVPTPTCS